MIRTVYSPGIVPVMQFDYTFTAITKVGKNIPLELITVTHFDKIPHE